MPTWQGLPFGLPPLCALQSPRPMADTRTQFRGLKANTCVLHPPLVVTHISQGVPHVVTMRLSTWEPFRVGEGPSYAREHNPSPHGQLQGRTYQRECCHLSRIWPVPVRGCDTGQRVWRHLRWTWVGEGSEQNTASSSVRSFWQKPMDREGCSVSIWGEGNLGRKFLLWNISNIRKLW